MHPLRSTFRGEDNLYMILEPTCFAVEAGVAVHAFAVVGIYVVVARGSILTRMTVTFVDI